MFSLNKMSQTKQILKKMLSPYTETLLVSPSIYLTMYVSI